MALIKFDSKNLILNVQVGALEEYTPDKEIKRISNKVEKLKRKTQDTMVKLVGDVRGEAAIKLLNSDEKKKNRWINFLKKEYNKEVKLIIEAINSKNAKICPGFKSFISNK